MTVHFDGSPDEFDRLIASILSPLAVKLDSLSVKLDQLFIKENQMNADLNTLESDVAAETTITASAVTLLNGLSAQLKAAAQDPAKIQAIATGLEANSAALAAAIAANTPVAPTAVVPPPVGP